MSSSPLEGSGRGHRSHEAAGKLAETLTKRYFQRLDPTQTHQANIKTWVRPELLHLTNQALAAKGRRLPPRVRARVEAFVENLCHAVPESSLPQALAKLASRISSAASSQPSRNSTSGLDLEPEPVDGEASVETPVSTERDELQPATPERAAAAAGPSSASSSSWLGDGRGSVGSRGSWTSYDVDVVAPTQPQISEAEMELRLISYITAVWASEAASKAAESARNDYQGHPEAAKSADLAAREAIHNANATADSARIEATCKNFVSSCRSQSALMPRATVLQNIRPRGLLQPLLTALIKEVLGLPCIDATADERLHLVLQEYDRRHSWWQPVEVNVETVLKGLLEELVVWLRLNEDSIAANCATEEMLAGIDPELRRRLKSQVYYSADHFMSVFKQFEESLSHLPIPLQPLLDHSSDMDEAQAFKDMNREKFKLNGVPVPPHECPARLHDLILAGLEQHLTRDKRDRSQQPSQAPPTSTPATTPPPALDTDRGVGGGNGPATEPAGEQQATLSRHLCMRTIHATSRTASGGDAFFIVQELYGGDGVLVKQSFVTAPPIEIDVNETGITVRSQDSYEVYHEDEVVMATIEALPLMLITTTMTETIPYPSMATVETFMHRSASTIGDWLGHSDAMIGSSESNDCRRFLKVEPHKPRGREKKLRKRSNGGGSSGGSGGDGGGA